MRIALLIVFMSCPAEAAPATGRLVGRVVEADNSGVAGALVVAEQGGPVEIARSTIAGVDGAFAIDDLMPGAYRIRASAEDRPAGEASAVVEPDAESAVSVTVGPRPEPPRVVRNTGGFLSGAPLSRRTPEVAVGVLRARPDLPAPGGRRLSWQLGNFDFTHPITGRPAVRLSLNAFHHLEIDEGAGSAWGNGALVTLGPASGSNRFDGHAALRAGDGEGATEAALSAPLLRDSLWLAAWGQASREPGQGTGGQGLGKLSWQVAPRHRLTLVGAITRDADRADLVGLDWEALLSDNVVVRAGASTLQARDAVLGGIAMQQAQAELRWYLPSRSWGEQDVVVQVHGASLAADLESGRAASRRGRVELEDSWRLTRYFSVIGALGGASARKDGGGSVAGWSASLATVWDPTHDGRTAIRVRASRAVSPGLVAPACPGGCLTLASLEQIAAGFDREVIEGLLGGAEGLLRRQRDDAGAGRDGWMILRLLRRAGRAKASVVYRRRLFPSGRNELNAMTGLGLAPWLSLGVLAAHAPRSTVAVLLDEPPPANDASAWLLGAQLRAELGRWLGFSSALWVDLPDLTRNARRFRLGLRAEF